MSLSAIVAQQLLQIKAVKLNPTEPFTWASGMLSPIYCDNRVALSYPSARNIIKEALVEKSSEFQPFDAIAGVATAGIPHGALLADALNLPFVYVRAAAKDHGRKNLIEGELPENARVLVIEDLISTGGSCLKAVDILQEAGVQISGILAIFQYGFEAANLAFAEKNLPFATLTDYPTLIRQAVDMGYVAPQDLAILEQWRSNPQGWGALYA
jgi:orotate phosphoribosyltransferase